jgi:hypothetical protein
LTIFALFFLLGCTQVNVCGDNICQVGEENTCPTDCAPKLDSTINVYVNGAWDATGNTYIRWYYSKDVSASINSNVISRLGDHWFGEQNKNLYLSFNDSKSGELPITRDKREYQLKITEPGEYYFEAISEDYSYRAVSEKIIVNESGDYYVSLSMTPSNPAVRIKAVDDRGNILSGEGKINLYYVEENWEYGEYVTNEWLYSSAYFNESDEINALFFVYNSTDLVNRNVYYRAVVEIEGYEPYTVDVWGARYQKYSEYYAHLVSNKPTEKGNLKIRIVPGINTGKVDLNKLVGLTASVCPVSYAGKCNSEVIDSDLSINLSDYYYGDYRVYASYYDQNQMPVSLDTDSALVTIDSAEGSAEIKGIRGALIILYAYEGKRGVLADPEKVILLQVCTNYLDQNKCYEYSENTTWKNAWGTNPGRIPVVMSSESQIEAYSKLIYTIDMLYGDKEGTLNVRFVQGIPTAMVIFK